MFDSLRSRTRRTLYELYCPYFQGLNLCSGLSCCCLSRDKKNRDNCIHSFNFFVILVGEQAGEWKATSKWQETSTTCVELLQMQAILWFEGTLGDH